MQCIDGLESRHIEANRKLQHCQRCLYVAHLKPIQHMANAQLFKNDYISLRFPNFLLYPSSSLMLGHFKLLYIILQFNIIFQNYL